MERHGPTREGRMAALHHGLGHNGEVLAAFLFAATVPANLLGRVVLEGAAMGANGAIWPACGFKPRSSGFLILEMRFSEFVLLGHRFAPMARILAVGACGVNYVIGNKILEYGDVRAAEFVATALKFDVSFSKRNETQSGHRATQRQ